MFHLDFDSESKKHKLLRQIYEKSKICRVLIIV